MEWNRQDGLNGNRMHRKARKIRVILNSADGSRSVLPGLIIEPQSACPIAQLNCLRPQRVHEIVELRIDYNVFKEHHSDRLHCHDVVHVSRHRAHPLGYIVAANNQMLPCVSLMCAFHHKFSLASHIFLLPAHNDLRYFSVFLSHPFLRQPILSFVETV
jgi:hypothetical protein